MIIGYARISTKDQKIDSQLELLNSNGCDKIFTDIASGVRTNRSGLLKLKSILRKGDTILVYRTDRIFRSLSDMVKLIEEFSSIGVKFRSLSEPEFDTSSANGKFLLHIFSAVAEFERNLISERTKIGLDSARRKNKTLGRPKGPKLATLEKYEYALHLYKNKSTSITKACKQANISKSTFYEIDKIKSFNAKTID